MTTRRHPPIGADVRDIEAKVASYGERSAVPGCYRANSIRRGHMMIVAGGRDELQLYQPSHKLAYIFRIELRAFALRRLNCFREYVRFFRLLNEL